MLTWMSGGAVHSSSAQNDNVFVIDICSANSLQLQLLCRLAVFLRSMPTCFFVVVNRGAIRSVSLTSSADGRRKRSLSAAEGKPYCRFRRDVKIHKTTFRDVSSPLQLDSIVHQSLLLSGCSPFSTNSILDGFNEGEVVNVVQRQGGAC